MNRIFGGMFDCVKEKKGYFFLLVILSVVSIVLGVIAAINLKNDLTISLGSIAYIKFLKGSGGFVSLIFGLLLSIMIFFSVITICNWKSFLLPLGILFYLYLVYSQSFIFTSIILIYGIFNCIILAVLLLVYSLLVWMTFLLILCELLKHVGRSYYFKSCFSFKESKILWFLIWLVVLTLVFSIVLVILKNYVILLIF